MSDQPRGPQRLQGFTRREIILGAVCAVFFGGLGVVVGSTSTGNGGGGNLNSLASTTGSTPSASPLPQLSISGTQSMGPGPTSLPGDGSESITVSGCGSGSRSYDCADSTIQLAQAVHDDESTAAALVTPTPTTVDGRRAAVYLHALTVAHCATTPASCNGPDNELARAIGQRVRDFRVLEAQDALAEWTSFRQDECSFNPGFAPAWEPPASCYDKLDYGTIFGSKDTTPSEAQFTAWGRDRALTQLLTPSAQDFLSALPASISRLTPTDNSVAQATGVTNAAGALTTLGASEVVGGGAGAATGLAALAVSGNAAKVPLFNAVFPYAAKVTPGAVADVVDAVAARAATALVGAASFTVGVILTAGVILIQRAIDIANAVNPDTVTHDLQANITSAQAVPSIASVADDPTHQGPLDLLDLVAAAYGQSATSSGSPTTYWDGGSDDPLVNSGGESDDPAWGLAHRNTYGWDAGGTAATLRAYNDPSSDGSSTCSFFTGNGLSCADPNHLLTQTRGSNAGNNYFWGGAANTRSTLTQTIDFNRHVAKRSTLVASCLGAHGGRASIQLTFENSSSAVLSNPTYPCPSQATGVLQQSGQISQSDTVPSGATKVVVQLQFNGGSPASLSANGSTLPLTNNDSALDQVSFTLSP